MRLCDVEATRVLLEYNFNSRCKAENTPILEELIRLRSEHATILSYKTHAHFALETRMAKSPDTVVPFLLGLCEKLQPLMTEELAYWRELKTEVAVAKGEPIPVGGVEILPSDMEYFTRLSQLKKYAVDDQRIKQYFSMEVVTAGLLDIYQRTFGLLFTEVKDRAAHAVWADGVQLFEVKDADTLKVRGYFYLDLYPREGKYGHAAVFPLRAGCALNDAGDRQLPVSAMVTNFPKSTPELPSLLSHSNVVTYFHEFGHVIHGIASEVTFSRFAGTAVERDFVEAPSQMLENCKSPADSDTHA
jgi:thimet oligopeptidase